MYRRVTGEMFQIGDLKRTTSKFMLQDFETPPPIVGGYVMIFDDFEIESNWSGDHGQVKIIDKLGYLSWINGGV